MITSQYYKNGRQAPARSSYAGLNCSYMAMIDKELARKQFLLTKKKMALQTPDGRYAAIKEYLSPKKGISFDVDAGAIVEGFSPSGSAFVLGAATILGDWQFRRQLLNTADTGGHTIRQTGLCHYQLAELMLTGEAITLAMRTVSDRY